MFFNTDLEIFFTLYSILMFLYSYNLALIAIFSPIFQKRQLVYTFSDISKQLPQSTILITTVFAIYSLAGVPPFLGFYPKVYLLVLLTKVYFSMWYVFILLLFLASLYFYMNLTRTLLQKQNIEETLYPSSPFLQKHDTSYFWIFVVFILLSGILFCDDLFFITIWFFF